MTTKSTTDFARLDAMTKYALSDPRTALDLAIQVLEEK